MITAHASKRRVQSVSRFRHIDQLIPLVGVLALFVIWWLISVSGWVNPVLLPIPWTTIAALFQAMFTDNMAIDFGATVLRTFSAFLLAEKNSS